MVLSMRRLLASGTALSLLSGTTNAIELDLDNPASIRSAASTIAHGMMSYYSGNETGQVPGLLPKPPYYWWEAGAMFGSLIDYWYYTGDTTYNDNVMQAMLFQVGEGVDYEPRNQTSNLGNDDQSFWAMSAMSAAELKFPNPPPNEPQWLALVQAVFNRQASRWDTSTCGGGLRWQAVSINAGYNYKNTIANGPFAAIAARLGAYTQNQTYFDWAERSWDWMSRIGLINEAYQVFDGSEADKLNCSQVDQTQWTYNAGIMLLTAATMWNQTTGDVQGKWGTRVSGLLGANMAFFRNQTIMYEVSCEINFAPSKGICNTDQHSFKAYLSRWYAATTKLAPWTAPTILPLLRSSATAAAAACSGGSDGVTCPSRWWMEWDGEYGVGQQMSALEVIQSNLIQSVAGPVSNTTGGTSQGDPNAGMGVGQIKPPAAITMRDKGGAGALTAIWLVIMLGGSWFMISD
nr:hypothetical protein B0A51_06504 [Rachicladosporium sp. CCFEE 5018]